MKLTSEREQEIRNMVINLSPYSVIPELLSEIDFLREDNQQHWLELSCYVQQNKLLKDVLNNILKVSRECANDYEFGEKGYYHWMEQAKELLK